MSKLKGQVVLITGGARGIGAETARRLVARGAKVVLVDLDREPLDALAAELGPSATATIADVCSLEQMEAAVAHAVQTFGGLDVVMANAGIAAQLPVIGGDPEVFERTLRVNLNGVYYTLRAAGPHIAHPGGYALAVASLAAAIHLPLLAAYSTSKAAVEALGNTLRIELRGSGARVGVAYFAEIDTDMTSRGFGTQAARQLTARTASLRSVAPLSEAIDAIERGIERRARRVYAPRWVGPLLPIRMVAQRVVERAVRRDVDRAVELARAEDAPLTTAQPR
jgi:NAD(P)-dependent dehydrogenase (short-subunit alcohol dehydrogenase family)